MTRPFLTTLKDNNSKENVTLDTNGIKHRSVINLLRPNGISHSYQLD